MAAKTGRAPEAILNELHSLLAGALKDELAAAIARSNDAECPKPIPAALLDKVMKFLKDNGVDAPATSERISSLEMTLGEIDLEEEASKLHH